MQVPYLGFLCDSQSQTFRLLPSRKEKFVTLLDDILSQDFVTLLSLQRLAGKCNSLSLAVPGARLFTNEMNLAIARGFRSKKPIKLSGSLREEVQHWLFLKSWTGSLPWSTEKHVQVLLASDASSYAWGGISFSSEAMQASIHDFWPPSLSSAIIVVKETLAVANVLKSFLPAIRNSWVDIMVDNQSFIHSWRKHGARSHHLSDALKPRPPPTPLSFELDLHSIDARLAELRLAASAAPYEKQKSALQQELETFLAALPLPKNLHSSSPDDICKFLVWKDRLGKTQVHATGCPHLGKEGITLCGCPTRLAYGTVDYYIGKLRAIFRNTGQDEPWDGRLQSGNPASAQVVRDYLKAVTSEQLQARVTPKQAHLLFMQKLLLLPRFLSKQMTNTTVTPTDLFILARDQAYFKALFISGDRGADLGLVKTPEILRFPDDTGFLFHHIWGKTLQDGSSNVFGLKRHPNQILCPIAAMETYVAIASELGINLSHGYLFRPTDPHGRIVDKPLTHPTAESRLKIYLTQAGIDEGETLHSFRSGCANTLALSGVRLADVMGHIGWRSDKTALYYLKLSEVLK
ncbi:hypothetical protein QZH41_016499, partial [Actinostola sp. cb2023]